MATYEERTQAGNLRITAQVRAAQDIAPYPSTRIKRCHKRALQSFRYFCEKYFVESFRLDWSEDHLTAIDKIEKATNDGGLFAFAMPRGSGKTTLCERATLWAILTGRHKFVALIGADMSRSSQMLKTLKIEMECNDLLYRDFGPELHSFRRLEGEARRCAGQRYLNERTRVVWTSTEVVFGHVPDSLCSGAIIKISALEASIRGMKHTLPSGESTRPSLAILDDPQTRDSARSEAGCELRETIVAGDVLGMAGPGKKIAALMPCTVIEKNDMADRILNRKLHPDWQGERTKMLIRFPDDMKKWNEYGELREDCLRSGRSTKEASLFYWRNRKAMDVGAVVSWSKRKNDDEYSAIQNAMNLYFRDERAFMAEYQNDPMMRHAADDDQLTIDHVIQKTSGLARGVAGLKTVKVTAFIDVQQAALYWVLVAWEEGFAGNVIDYGIYPQQSRKIFALSGLQATLQKAFPQDGLEAQIYKGLDALCVEMMKPIKREDGAELEVDVCFVDSNWGASTDAVRQFCRRSMHAGRLIPSMGKGVGASSLPMGELRMYKGRKAGEIYGLNWQTSMLAYQRHVLYDTNFWKSFVRSRFFVSVGDSGCLALFEGSESDHRLFAEHMTSEYSIRTEAAGRAVDEWKVTPARKDNHWFDCIVGAAVAASYNGISLKSEAKANATKPKRAPRKVESTSRPLVASRGDGRGFFTQRR